MDKIVGKLFLLLLCCNVAFINAGIRLDVKTSDGIATQAVVVGQPFLVEVTIDNVQGSVQAPTIAGLEQCVVRRTGMYMSSINGASTTKYTYQVRADNLGTYHVGPARVVHERQELLSNVATIVVGKDIPAPTQQKNKNSTHAAAQQPVLLRLMVDNERVVVGQKIKASLRFYYQDSGITLSTIGQPDFVDFEVKQASKPVGGSQNINGNNYKFAEWQWELYPKKSGDLTIPAYSADYELPAHDNRMFGNIFMFLNMHTERKRVYSNAVKLVVDPLPQSAMPVKAVGVFESITAHISPPVAKKGEGMVLVLEISGEGNFDAIMAPCLSLPTGLKYYDSNTSFVKATDSTELSKKCFEYIVQGVEPGDWEIPAQKFVYFDTAKHAYVTLKTSPLFVSIQEAVGREDCVAHAPHDAVINGDKKNVVQEVIAPLDTRGLWYPVSPRFFLPWFLFYLFVIFPLVYIVFSLIKNESITFGRYSRYMKKKAACKSARSKIIRCMSENDEKKLYLIFIDLFAQLSQKPCAQISLRFTQDYFLERGISYEKVGEWNSFFEHIAHAAYAHAHNNSTQEIGRMALEWIDILEKVI